jgi:phosphohistidine phosphatase
MKTLMLLRHATSSWKNSEIADHDRPLNKRGKKAAPLMGHFLSIADLVPDLILSSTAVRARETAEAVARASSYEGPVEFLDSLYLATAGTVLSEAQSRAPDSVGRLLLVGHNPGMEDLVEILSGKREALPTAALAVFEVGIDRWAALELGVETKLLNIYRPKDIDPPDSE